MRSRLQIWTFAFVVVFALLNLSLLPVPVNAAGTVPRYEKAPCAFDTSRTVKVECGYLVVPENRSKTNSPTIRLHVAVFKTSAGRALPDPVIFLDGGPGGHTLESAVASYSIVFKAFGAKRDFIMFDQRGVGFSTPNLDCPESTAAWYDNIDKPITFKERMDLDHKALLECHARLVKQGVDLSAYNSAENAADVNDLLHALGYKQWNLYGISYGTRLALTVMRDFPDGIRSVILDSTVPLQVDMYVKLPGNVDRAFQVFFQGCLKNLRCNTAYPHLDKVFYDLVKKLNAQPITISVTQPLTRKKIDVLIDGDTYINMLFHSLYSADTIVWLPKAIWDAYNGEFSLMTRYMGGATVKKEYESVGMYYSVQCAEEVSFDTEQQLVNADQGFPKLNKVFDMSSYTSICKEWNVKAAPDLERKAVTSAAPTLILAGQYDPITPPSYGYQASQTLKHSYYIEFTGVGHGVSVGSRCPYDVSLAFLDNPSMRPNIGCMTFMKEPEFVTGN